MPITDLLAREARRFVFTMALGYFAHLTWGFPPSMVGFAFGVGLCCVYYLWRDC